MEAIEFGYSASSLTGTSAEQMFSYADRQCKANSRVQANMSLSVLLPEVHVKVTLLNNLFDISKISINANLGVHFKYPISCYYTIRPYSS